MIAAKSPAEPIPGYQLLDRLGQGGFGEVWRARAPGGIMKAIKIVYGCLDGGGGEEEEIRVRQELKALERVKGVRHPYILSLERYDIVDGQLFIVMELADRSLFDRYQECKNHGLPGIPREELLRYMEEAAEALDLMNTEYQLQHLDIKPQNLFLLYNHVKVGDFGLVKGLEGVQARMTSGITPLYASPETFDGVVSRFSDQYNLGIVYEELLTGQLPFTGTNPRQLMAQHLSAVPNLDPLPPRDRPAIARALSKKPDDRFPSCGDFVRALRLGEGALTPIPSTQEDMAKTATMGRKSSAGIAIPSEIRSDHRTATARPTPPPMPREQMTQPWLGDRWDGGSRPGANGGSGVIAVPRGNSGVYMQGRYEVQILDSFGLDGKDNECGAVYSLAAPSVNMCYPPLSWQTYDIDYTAARYDGAKKKTADAVITVRHNGVLVQNHSEILGETGHKILAKYAPHPPKGPIKLQDHGNMTRYRNIWVRPLDNSRD